MEREGDWMVVQGSLTMDTVPALFEAGLQQLANADFQLDLSRVDSVDSAAVSMLLGWSRAARGSGHALRVKGLPQDLLSLANLYGVAEMLPPQSS